MDINELLAGNKNTIDRVRSGQKSIDLGSLQNADEDTLRDAVNAVMGTEFHGFKGYQYIVINQILEGRDVLAVMPTSMGKSVCFQFPALARSGFTIVVEPLVSLLSDQSKNLNDDLCADTGKEVIAKYITAFGTNYERIKSERLLYVSPETLISPKFVRYIKERLKEERLAMLVVDEAHCVSTWGNDFRSDYLRIGRFFDMIDERPQVVAFTATATKLIRNDIKQVLKMQKPFDLVEFAKQDEEYFKDKELFKRDKLKLTPVEIKDNKHSKYVDKNLDYFIKAKEDSKKVSDKNAVLMSKAFFYLFRSNRPYHKGVKEYAYARIKLEKLIKRNELQTDLFEDTQSYVGKNDKQLKKRFGELLAADEGALADIKKVIVNNQYFEEVWDRDKNKELKQAHIRLIISWCSISLEKNKDKEHIAALAYCKRFKNPSLIEYMHQDREDKLADDIADVLKTSEGAVVVYCTRKQTIDALCKKGRLQKLLEDKKRMGKETPVLSYYADHPKKKKNQDLFSGEPEKYRVMVATNAFGMGINKKDIRRVIHYEIPADIESYFQEAGRAGRDGEPADALLYNYTPEVDNTQMRIGIEEKKDKSTAEDNGKDSGSFKDRLAQHRFSCMKALLNAKSIEDAVSEYFLTDDFGCESWQHTERKKAINEKAGRIENVIFNTSYPAYEILHKGSPHKGYLTGSDEPDGKKHMLWLGRDDIDYLDLMIANAVYTLGFNACDSVTVKKIFALLTGDKSAIPSVLVRKKLLDRIEILNDTDVKIYDAKGRNGKVLSGKFLRLRCVSDEGSEKVIFRYEGTPALFEYSESNSRMMNIRTKWLCIKDTENSEEDAGKKLVADTLENIRLKTYLAWRVHLLPHYRKGYDPAQQGRKNSIPFNIIRFENDDDRRQGMYELLGITLPYSRKRKKIEQTIQQILEHYKTIKAIKDYAFMRDESGHIVGVRLDRLSKYSDDSQEVGASKLLFTLNEKMEELSDGKIKPKFAEKNDNGLDQFDLLLMNAVFTLDKSGVVRIDPGAVYALLSGDKTARLKLCERNIIIQRLEKLRKARIKISNVSVSLLPLEKVDDGSYRCRAVSAAFAGSYENYAKLLEKKDLDLFDVMVYDACVRVIKKKSSYKKQKSRKLLTIDKMSEQVHPYLTDKRAWGKAVKTTIEKLFKSSADIPQYALKNNSSPKQIPLFCTDGNKMFLRPKKREENKPYYMLARRYSVESIEPEWLCIKDKSGKVCVSNAIDALVLKAYVARKVVQMCENGEGGVITTKELREKLDEIAYGETKEEKEHRLNILTGRMLQQILRYYKREGLIKIYHIVRDKGTNEYSGCEVFVHSDLK